MSFIDLMSSGRGPGVIGLVLALTVLIGFGSLFTFATDSRFQGGDQSIESVIAYQAKELGVSQRSVESGLALLSVTPERSQKIKEVAKLKLANQALKQRVVTLTGDVVAAKAEEILSYEAFESYKNQYRAHVWGAAKDTTLATLETQDGTVYKNVSIREVTAVGIQIRHDDGFKRIPIEDLSPSMKDYYQFDPKQKAAAVATEQAMWSQHEAAAAVADDLAAKEHTKQKSKDTKLAQEKTLREITAMRSQITSLQAEIVDLRQDLQRATETNRAARAAGRVLFDKSAGILGDIQSKERQISVINAEISMIPQSDLAPKK